MPAGLRAGIRSGCRLFRRGRGPLPDVPTLFRFLLVMGVLAGLVIGAMVAVVAFVKPEQREMIEIVPPARLQPK